jgi:hypothetical protein
MNGSAIPRTPMHSRRFKYDVSRVLGFRLHMAHSLVTG